MVMSDISHLRTAEQKQLGVVSEISQNLRSPLTAVIGYTELLDRIGSLNEHSKQFSNFVPTIATTFNAQFLANRTPKKQHIQFC